MTSRDGGAGSAARGAAGTVGASKAAGAARASGVAGATGDVGAGEVGGAARASGVAGAAGAAAPAYEARSADERRLAELVERLPEMLRTQDVLARHHEAQRLCEKYRAVDDLGLAIDGIEAQTPLPDPESRRLYDVMLREKRSAYRDEKARLDHDLAASSFANMAQADAARLPRAEALELEGELNRYREEYALALAKCEAADSERG